MNRSLLVLGLMLLVIMMLAMVLGMNVKAMLRMHQRIQKHDQRITVLERKVRSLEKGSGPSSPGPKR